MIGPDELIDFLSQQRSRFAEYPERPELTQIIRAIDTVIELVRDEPRCWQLVWIVYDAASKVANANTILQTKPYLKRGIAAIKGGEIGAARSHAATQELHKKAREEYAKHDRAHPTASRKSLCDAVEEALGGKLKAATIARLIPDPKRRRGRGRPSKP